MSPRENRYLFVCRRAIRRGSWQTWWKKYWKSSVRELFKRSLRRLTRAFGIPGTVTRRLSTYNIKKKYFPVSLFFFVYWFAYTSKLCFLNITAPMRHLCHNWSRVRKCDRINGISLAPIHISLYHLQYQHSPLVVILNERMNVAWFLTTSDWWPSGNGFAFRS